MVHFEGTLVFHQYGGNLVSQNCFTLVRMFVKCLIKTVLKGRIISNKFANLNECFKSIDEFLNNVQND